MRPTATRKWRGLCRRRTVAVRWVSCWRDFVVRWRRRRVSESTTSDTWWTDSEHSSVSSPAATPQPPHLKGKGSPYSNTERRVLGSQPAGDVSHKPGGRLRLLSARPATYPRNPSEGCCQFRCLVNRGTMGVNSLLKTALRLRFQPGPFCA